MSPIQLVAVRSTSHESLEITRWVHVNEGNVEQAEKEMLALVDRFYLKLSRKSKKEHEKVMLAVGISSEVLDVPYDKVENLTRKIHYALYEGYCLDPKRLLFHTRKNNSRRRIYTGGSKKDSV